MARKNSFENLSKLDKSYLLDPSLNQDEEIDIPSEVGNNTTDIAVELLVPFKNHPFRVDTEAEKFEELLESVKEYGVIQPILVRHAGENYEIISGHCRVEAARLAGLETVPANIIELDDFNATVFMAHSNIYGRDEILVSEKAKAYRMCLDEQKKMGANRGETAEFIGAGKDSKRQVYRYVRLSYLNDFLLSLIDSGKISVQTGTEFAFLDEESQESLVEYIEKLKQIPSLEQAKMLRAAEEENDQSLSYEKILSLLVSVPKPKVQNKVSFKTKELADYFAEGTSADEMSDIIKRLLEKYRSGEFELN